MLACLNFISVNYVFRSISGSFGFRMKQDKAKRLQLKGFTDPFYSLEAQETKQMKRKLGRLLIKTQKREVYFYRQWTVMFL